MRNLHRLIERAALSDITVLLLGETGVGKEVFARRLHALSPRASGPFLGLNCAAVAPSLFESELFGHERGAFTGAGQTKLGLLEAAEGGTVLLDEVGEMPLAIQVKLLRVLEERQVLRIGGTRAARDRRARPLGHQPQPRGRGRGRRVPARSLLPPQQHQRADPAAARAPRRRSSRSRAGSLRWRRSDWACAAPRDRCRRSGIDCAAPLARQHPRAAQRDGARGGALGPRPHHAERAAGGDRARARDRSRTRPRRAAGAPRRGARRRTPARTTSGSGSRRARQVRGQSDPGRGAARDLAPHAAQSSGRVRPAAARASAASPESEPLARCAPACADLFATCQASIRRASAVGRRRRRTRRARCARDPARAADSPATTATRARASANCASAVRCRSCVPSSGQRTLEARRPRHVRRRARACAFPGPASAAPT